MTEGKNIKEQINKLVSIKDIDAEIFDVESQLEIFPERIKEIEASLEAKKAGMDRAGEELKLAQLSKNEKELDLM